MLDWQASVDPTEPTRLVSAFNGDVSQDWTAPGRVSKIHHGHIYPENRYKDVGNIHFLALLLTFRPLHPEFASIQPNELRVTADKLFDENGPLAVVVETPSAQPSSVREYWVDPNRDFVVVRCLFKHAGQRNIEIEAKYERDTQHGWLPSGWTASMFWPPNQHLLERGEATVTNCEVNPQVPEDVFAFKFPPGTFVVDERQKQKYIVRPGGLKRIVTPAEEEREATYADLLATESGMAGLPGKSSLYWLMGSVVALVVLWCAIWARRRA